MGICHGFLRIERGERARRGEVAERLIAQPGAATFKRAARARATGEDALTLDGM